MPALCRPALLVFSAPLLLSPPVLDGDTEARLGFVCRAADVCLSSSCYDLSYTQCLRDPGQFSRFSVLIRERGCLLLWTSWVELQGQGASFLPQDPISQEGPQLGIKSGLQGSPQWDRSHCRAPWVPWPSLAGARPSTAEGLSTLGGPAGRCPHPVPRAGQVPTAAGPEHGRQWRLQLHCPQRRGQHQCGLSCGDPQ